MYLQGEPSSRRLHFVDFYLVVPMSALFCLGSSKSGTPEKQCQQNIVGNQMGHPVLKGDAK